jgi:peptide deformylase
MALQIAQLGQPVLREVAQPVPVDAIDSEELQTFFDEMLETMQTAGGVGLAAPQVFQSLRVFLAAILPANEPGGKPRVEIFVNPRLSQLSPEMAPGWEGCLSFLELLVLVPRHRKLRIDYLDRTGKAKALELAGFPARVVQHEFDHLNGILTIDRAESTKDIIKASEYDSVVAEDEEDEDED